MLRAMFRLKPLKFKHLLRFCNIVTFIFYRLLYWRFRKDKYYLNLLNYRITQMFRMCVRIYVRVKNNKEVK